MAARKSPRATVLTPVSDTAAQLIHLLRQEAAEAAAPAPGTVVLPPHTGLRALTFDATYHSAHSADWETSLRLWFYPDRAHQVRWIGDETLRDDKGRTWERRLRMVIDDFGTLVEVQP